MLFDVWCSLFVCDGSLVVVCRLLVHCASFVVLCVVCSLCLIWFSVLLVS